MDPIVIDINGSNNMANIVMSSKSSSIVYNKLK